MLGALGKREELATRGPPRVELVDCFGEQGLGNSPVVQIGTNREGPRNPTLPHCVAKLEPTRLPSRVAPKAATCGACQRP